MRELTAFIPAAADCCDCLEASWGELFRARVAAIHSPVEKVDLVGVELQEEDDDFTAKLMNLYHVWGRLLYFKSQSQSGISKELMILVNWFQDLYMHILKR